MGARLPASAGGRPGDTAGAGKREQAAGWKTGENASNVTNIILKNFLTFWNRL